MSVGFSARFVLQGVCNRDSGECECYSDYEGAACERSVCPNGCSGHGVCEYIQEFSDMDGSEWECTSAFLFVPSLCFSVFLCVPSATGDLH